MIREKNRATIDADAELVKSCRKGDLRAFETLVEKYRNRMFTLVYRILGDYDDAAEVTQDAFVAAWRALGKFRGEALFSTWLTRIAVNLSRNRLQQTRTRSSREAYSLDEPIPGCEECRHSDPPSDGPSAQEVLEREEIRIRVQGCINGLDPGYREVLVLRDVEEYSYGEIGGMLGLAEGTVKSRISRAREAIRGCLKRVLGEI
jgi:RNA polymerase sigma-70 factor (ECF subfamily)